MTNYEMVEKLSEKMHVSLEEAKAALEASDWDMLDAALLLEKKQGAAGGTYSTRQAPRMEFAEKEPAESRWMLTLRGIGQAIVRLVRWGNRNRFEAVRRDGEVLVDMPVTALALLLIFAFWVCVPMLVIGLFAGFRYRFKGAELGREGINRAMDKASETAEKVKESFTR